MAYMFLCNDIVHFQFVPKSLLLPKKWGEKTPPPTKKYFAPLLRDLWPQGSENNRAEMQHRVGWVKEEEECPQGIRKLTFQGKGIELLKFGKGLNWSRSGVQW